MRHLFRDEVLKVEERFHKSYDGVSMADAKAESAVNVQMVSAGWWVSLKSCQVAVWFGDNKPDLKAGDGVTLSMEKDIIL